ncbi:aldose 1-epimerase family protein [Acidisoma sp.]|uniref:aldose 1-epimerase family protein n=1 Tax=Acidisoma sp. TaxID=1872115 RepID=UPI003AFF967B
MSDIQASAGGDRHTMTNTWITAVVLAQGAELCSLQGEDGHEFLWQAGPEWPRHSPVLFPIVGRLSNDSYTHEGQTYRLSQHGFARDRRFTWVARTETSCVLRLEDDPQTHTSYPYPFRLEIAYQLEPDGLTVRYTVSNPGEGVLPASLGAHPGFVWPILPGVEKHDHELRFARSETAPIHGVSGGLLTAAVHTSPVVDRVLQLTPELFAEDALVFTTLSSRSARFSGQDTPVIEVSWEGFEQLGVWSKPTGGDFLCIEPWHGYASPEGYAGDLMEKPGMMLLPPGTQRELQWTVRVLPSDSGT